MTITLPIPLPTWNQLLRMHYLKRSFVNSVIKQYVSISILYASGQLTQTGYRAKLLLMESLKQEYLMTITAKSSKALRSRKSKARRSGR